MNDSFKDHIILCIGGDFCPIIAQTIESCVTGDAERIFGDLLPYFRSADFSLVNLEAPFVTINAPIVKTGKNFRLPPNCINVLEKVNIKCLNLANNHIFDHGEGGLRETIAVCKKAGLQWLGAGKNVGEAGEPLMVTINGLRVAFMAMADHEFSIATDDQGGANPLDIMDFVKTIRQFKSHYDHLIVLIHGGAEYYPYPSPKMQDISRFMAGEGASAIIWQHSHCPGSYEYFNDIPIIYGQGNLIAESQAIKTIEWHQGVLVILSLSHQKIGMKLIPYLQSYDKLGLRRMALEEEKQFLNELDERSHRIIDNDFIKKEWHKFCLSKKKSDMSLVRGHGKFFQRLNRYTNFAESFYSKHQLAALLNIFRCNIHQETFITILENILKRQRH